MAYADRSLPDLLDGAADFLRHVTAPDTTFEPLRCSICMHAAELIAALDTRARSQRKIDAPTEKCSRCGEFLSTIRVEMGLTKCGDCDGSTARSKGRR